MIDSTFFRIYGKLNLEQANEFLKFFPSFILFSSLGFPLMAQASDVISLPTITVMAEEELREEDVGILPYQEDEDVKEALRHKIYKLETDMQRV